MQLFPHLTGAEDFTPEQTSPIPPLLGTLWTSHLIKKENGCGILTTRTTQDSANTILNYSITKLTSKYLFCYHATNTSNHFLRKKIAFLRKQGEHLICCTKVTLQYYLQTSPVRPPLRVQPGKHNGLMSSLLMSIRETIVKSALPQELSLAFYSSIYLQPCKFRKLLKIYITW